MTRIKLVFQIPVLGPRGDVGVNLTLKCLYLHSEGNFSFDEGGGVCGFSSRRLGAFLAPQLFCTRFKLMIDTFILNLLLLIWYFSYAFEHRQFFFRAT